MSTGKPGVVVWSRKNRRFNRWWYGLWALAALSALAAMFVGLEVAERHLFPHLSIGIKHALLTVGAAILTGASGLLIYLVMRRHQKRLAETAATITGLIQSYAADRSRPVRFHNPNAKLNGSIDRDSLPSCFANDGLDHRCWQVVSLRTRSEESGLSVGGEAECISCPVYRHARPDELSELGESFNDLMFLLEEEEKKVGAMQSQLLEKEKMVAIGQMASGIAHEVCNPLSSISSIVQMLKRAKQQEAPPIEELELIETHIQRISSIVRQMVSLARPQEDRWESADIGSILAETVHLIRFDRRAKNVTIENHIEDGLPHVRVMNGNLGQVFLNLSLNALDAMPQGGKLTINARRVSSSIDITISDTGEGIDPAIRRRVFDPFFTTKEPGRGTGLGLAVSHSIIRKHEGTIAFEDNPGGGTVFTVTLPVASDKTTTLDQEWRHN